MTGSCTCRNTGENKGKTRGGDWKLRRAKPFSSRFQQSNASDFSQLMQRIPRDRGGALRWHFWRRICKMPFLLPKIQKTFLTICSPRRFQSGTRVEALLICLGESLPRLLHGVNYQIQLLLDLHVSGPPKLLNSHKHPKGPVSVHSLTLGTSCLYLITILRKLSGFYSTLFLV